MGLLLLDRTALASFATGLAAGIRVWNCFTGMNRIGVCHSSIFRDNLFTGPFLLDYEP